MKNYALALMVLTLSSTAFAEEAAKPEAPKCVDLSGVYEGKMTISEDHVVSTLTQTGCAALKIVAKIDGTAPKTLEYVIDGQSHPDPEQLDDRTYKASFEEGGTRLVITDTTKDSDTMIERRFWIENDTLIVEARISDNDAGEPITVRNEQKRVSDAGDGGKKVTDSVKNPNPGPEAGAKAAPRAPAAKTGK